MDNFDKQLETILIHRKPEFWLNDIFMSLDEYILDDCQDWLFYKKENILLFNYNLKTKNFYYDYDKIYLILKVKYNCNDNKIDELIKNMVEEHLKFGVKTMNNTTIHVNMILVEQLKLNTKKINNIQVANCKVLVEQLKLKAKNIITD